MGCKSFSSERLNSSLREETHCGRRGLDRIVNRVHQLALLSLHDVVQVTVVPVMQAVQTLDHRQQAERVPVTVVPKSLKR